MPALKTGSQMLKIKPKVLINVIGHSVKKTKLLFVLRKNVREKQRKSNVFMKKLKPLV